MSTESKTNYAIIFPFLSTIFKQSLKKARPLAGLWSVSKGKVPSTKAAEMVSGRIAHFACEPHNQVISPITCTVMLLVLLKSRDISHLENLHNI